MTSTATSTVRTYPLGPLQEPIWRFWQQNRQSTAYLMPEIYFFEGAFDLAAATAALDATARRHESLRTVFDETADGVVQVVSPEPAHAPIEVIDLRAPGGGAEQAVRLERVIAEASNTPFDLMAGPAIRLTAVLLSDSRTSLVLTAHQIVCDGTSMAIVIHDFGEFYTAALDGRQPELEPATSGYGAFVARQLSALSRDDSDADLDYWAARLEGATASVLPGRSDATERSADSRGARERGTRLISTTLEPDLAAQVFARARESATTPFALLLAVMSVLTAVATADPDVCIGVATSSRTGAWARTVGMLTNTVVPRTRVDLARTFADTQADVSSDLLDAIDYQDVPFGSVEARWRADGGGAAELVQTTFAGGALGGLTLGGGTVSERVARSSEGPFRLAVVCEIAATGIAFDWQFALSDYSPGVAAGYCRAYHEVMALVVTQPDVPLAALGLADVLGRVTAAIG